MRCGPPPRTRRLRAACPHAKRWTKCEAHPLADKYASSKNTDTSLFPFMPALPSPSHPAGDEFRDLPGARRQRLDRRRESDVDQGVALYDAQNRDVTGHPDGLVT